MHTEITTTAEHIETTEKSQRKLCLEIDVDRVKTVVKRCQN